MVEKFHTELDKLQEDVLEMGYLARDMLQKSIEALKNQDKRLAQALIENKIRIADMDDDIEQEALRLIALYQPMARDLRTIACVFKMITNFERIGRYGKDIATIAVELFDSPHIGNLLSIPHMSEMVCDMIASDLKAYESGDISYIHDLSRKDDDVDALRYSVFRECITYMMEDPKNITSCTDYVMIARYLERCGDHACKIGEKVHYMITGERIEIK
ncbi:MAG TPA: phosphate signaling complex protein PhoU [Methanomicrobiales archaeon]|nr:phosphate signaling complex protein PhoU [Methanomicrobiales archaeon]